MAKGAKVVIESGKTIKSPKALATQLLGGKNVADQQKVKDLAAKIKKLNNFEKGQDLTADLGPIKVGKIKTKKFGTLIDPSDKNKYSFYNANKTSGISTVSPVPNTPNQTNEQVEDPIKSASPDIILIDQDVLPVDLMLKLTLEKIGGQELISIARHDTVNGQNIIYQPIKNIADVAISYNPQNIIAIPETADIYFKNFAIRLENHFPQGNNETSEKFVYLDSVTGEIIIEAINLKPDYQIEVELAYGGKIFNDTIYEEET
jgi:hypothetical protein